MKRIICYFLVCVVILACIAGCVTNQPTNNTSTTTLPEETKPEKGSSLAEYDPEREIYFLFGNRYCDFYNGQKNQTLWWVTYYMISKNALDLDGISLSLPTEHPYSVEKFEEKVERGTEYMLNNTKGMPFYVYEAYQGIDFSDLYSEQYQQDVENALTAFKKLTVSDIPELYVYSFLVEFDHNIPYKGEEITYAEVTVDGEVYRQDIGCVRLMSDEDCPFAYETTGRITVTNVISGLYNDGLFQYSFGGNYTAWADMTVKELTFLGEGWTALRLHVTGTIGGMSSNFEWDGKSPFDLYEGDTISISGVLHNPHLDDLTYQFLLQAVMSIEVDGRMYGEGFAQRVVADTNYYELYAIIFDGVDMEPYYRGYYYEKNELWRKAYLDKIPKE